MAKLQKHHGPPRAGIGSQLSPAFCNVAITLIERSWAQLHHSLADHTQIHFTHYRYVDNRFITFDDIFLNHMGIQTLTQPDFVGNSVELEPVQDMHLLGFDVDLTHRTITYIAQNATCKIRGHASGGSQRLRLSGLTSRAHLIRNGRALSQLAHLYAQKGHDLVQCIRLVRGKVKLLLSHSVHSRLTNTL